MEPVLSLSPERFTASSTELRKSAPTRAQYKVIASAYPATPPPPSVSTVSGDGGVPDPARFTAASTAWSVSS